MAALLATATQVGAQAPDDVIVARVGKMTITAGELDRRIAAVPPFQLRSLGSTPETIREAFLDRVLVRDLLFAQGGEAEALQHRGDVEERVDRVMRSTMLDALRVESGKLHPVTDAEVKAYFDANPQKFRSPPRIAIWRILVPTREEAVALIEQAKKDPSLKAWNEIARDKSLDKATNMRGGNLGFVAPDGTTAEVGVKVAPALYEAASRVKDSEIVAEPVKEGERYAVIWRRQSMREVIRTIDQEAQSIRQVLGHEKAERSVRELVAALREAHLSELNAERVDQIDVTSTGQLQPMRRPGSLPDGRSRNAGPPAPVQGPGGLR